MRLPVIFKDTLNDPQILREMAYIDGKGVAGINTGLISFELAPFGGTKESGIGREGSK